MNSFKNKKWENKKYRLTINFTQMYDLERLVIPKNWDGPDRVSHIRAAREAGVLLRTCPRCSLSPTSVVKFLLSRFLHPENHLEKPNRCSAMLPLEEALLERTGLIKMRLRFLDRGMCKWHVRSNTQQGKLLGFVVLSHALYCEEIPLA